MYNSCVEQPKNIPERALDDMVFVSQSALQLCEIALADPVLVTTQESAVVKTAWPTKDKTLTSVSLTKHGKYRTESSRIINVKVPLYACFLQR